MNIIDDQPGVPAESGAHNHSGWREQRSTAHRGGPLSPRARPIQTLARAYAAVRAGEDPWVAFNEFFHEWFDYSRDQRAELVAEPIPSDPDVVGSDQWRWAVFCAAAADYLCTRDHIAHPAWVDDPVYVLLEPWYGFGDPGASAPEVRAYLERVTLEPLRRRNILGGERVFANKYDVGR